MAPDLLGQPDPMIDQPGAVVGGEIKISEEGLAQIWKALPLKKDKKRGLPALREALERVVKDRSCSVQDAEEYMLDQVVIYEKYAGPYLRKRSASGMDSGKVMYPQGWFNGNQFEEDEQTWRLTFGVPEYVANTERIEAEERRQKLADAEAKRRAIIDREHEKEVIASLSDEEQQAIVDDYRKSEEWQKFRTSDFHVNELRRMRLRYILPYLWAIETGRVPAPDYSQRKDS